MLLGASDARRRGTHLRERKRPRERPTQFAFEVAVVARCEVEVGIGTAAEVLPILDSFFLMHSRR